MMVESPDFLASPVGRGAGVRRLNRRPLIIAGVIICLLLAAVSYTYQMRLAALRRKDAERQDHPEPVGVPAILKDAPAGGLIAPREPPLLERSAAPPSAEKPEVAPVPPLIPYAEEWASYREALARHRHAREEAAIRAIGAATGLKVPAHLPAANGAQSPTAETLRPGGELASLYAADALRERSNALGQGDDARDLNRAADKRAFLADRAPEAGGSHYLQSGRDAPASRYELKAGTIIPAIMIGGINSDLPGQILGQVSANVYDSASGRYILVPQGAKLVGSYDNGVTTGQDRVLIAWTRIILPDGSSIDLGKMPGSDPSGFAGFHDQVNSHFLTMLSSALMLSVLSAGVQISQGGQNPSDNGLNAQQSIAAGLGQQFGQLGQELTRRNAQLQPTLEIRAGYRFTVAVTKDMVIRPWIPVTGSMN